MSVSKRIIKNMVIVKFAEMGSSWLAEPPGTGEKATAKEVVCIPEHASKPSTSDLYLWPTMFWRISTFIWGIIEKGLLHF